MSSIINESSLTKIDKMGKIILKAGIWVLIGGVIMGALAILVTDESSTGIIAKVMGTMFILVLMMMISVNNFHRLTSDKASVQVFAIVGLISNITWAVLWCILVWNPDWLMVSGRSYVLSELSMLAKFASAFSYLSALGFIGSNIMSIYEGEKKGVIKPLKITATACATYEMIYFTVLVFTNFDYTSELSVRLGALAGFAGFVWIVILVAALVISKGEKNRRAELQRRDREKKAEKYEDAVIASANAAKPAEVKTGKTDDELKAEIEEKVRREMIEKEVRERLEAERAEKTGDSK